MTEVCVKPTVVEVKILEEKGRIKDEWTLSKEEVEVAMKGELDNIRAWGTYLSTIKNDCDVKMCIRDRYMVMLCRFTVTSPDIVIWLSVMLYYWAFISISTLILLISLLLSPNSGGGGIFHCPAGCAITCTSPWEETGKASSASI